MIGKTLSNYSIIGVLGTGGMGTVYLAKDARLGRTVALKVLPESLSQDPVRRKRFTLEARSASALKHANVAHVYDVGEVEGVSFIVMEHIEGETLADRLAREPVTVTRAVGIATQIADALADAHRRRITHRDIKPANVMLTGRGEIKVLDFGLAHLDHSLELTTDTQAPTIAGSLTGELTNMGQILGTVPYMSPEQARGEAVGPRSDVFSLGVVLYEMLAGRRPFAGRTPKETIESILEGEPPDVTKWNAEVPEPVAQVVRRCLDPDPDSRYATAEGLFADLRALNRPEANGSPGSEPTRPSPSSEGDASRIESVAVMPFENGSNDEEAEYLCEGLAENLIATLARLPDLRVISRHATFGLKDEPKDVRSLGERLQVDALVLGNLKPRGERIIVNVELVGVPDGRRLWGDRYDRPIGEAFAIEQEVAGNISRELQEALSSDEVSRIVKNEVDPQAYLLYLKGRPLIIGSATQMLKGAEFLEEATRLDPSYALPHAALVESYMAQAFHNVLDPVEAAQKARSAARTAVRLDPDLPEAQTALGIVSYVFDWDWAGADEAFRRAVTMGPGRDVPHLEYAEFLGGMGRLPEALVMASRARELDPVSPNPTHMEAYTRMLMGDYEAAIQAFKEAIALHPNWIWGHIKLAGSYSRSGRHNEAMAEAEIAEAALHGGGTPLSRSWLARVYGAAGDTERAREMLAALQSSDTVTIDPLTRLYVHSVLGEKDRALDCVERAFRERSPLCCYLLCIDLLEPHLKLSLDPRFLAIIERMGLPAPPRPLH